MATQHSMYAAVEKKLNKWATENNEIQILITGKTGTGKSALIKSLTGVSAVEGHTLNPETTEVKDFSSTTVGGVKLKVWDSPGLQDGTDNERQYLAMIRKRCCDVDLIIYCIKMHDTRLLENCDDSKAMQKLYGPSCLGAEKWKNTIIVLTFANLVEKKAKYQPDQSPVGKQKFYKEEYELTVTAIKGILTADVKLAKEMIQSIPIIPAGYHTRLTLPDLQTSDASRCYWLSDLWLKSLNVTKLDAQPAMIKLNESRMAISEKEYQGRVGSTKESIARQLPLIFAEKGTEFGSRSYSVLSGEGTEEGRQSGLALGHKLSSLLLAKQAEKNKILTEEEYHSFCSVYAKY